MISAWQIHNTDVLYDKLHVLPVDVFLIRLDLL